MTRWHICWPSFPTFTATSSLSLQSHLSCCSRSAGSTHSASRADSQRQARPSASSVSPSCPGFGRRVIWGLSCPTGTGSNFARTGVGAVTELVHHGMLQSDAFAAVPLRQLAANEACVPSGKPPHIILVHDESSFDITVAPGMKVPPGYPDHFRSFDG